MIRYRGSGTWNILLDGYPSLNKISKWYDSLPNTFKITHVGGALEHTNARRCDDSLPELPLIEE